MPYSCFFFFQAEDGIRDLTVTGVQTCALPISSFPEAPRGIGRLKQQVVTAFLHLLQPLARLAGRLRAGLTPWRQRAKPGRAPLWPPTASGWSGQWVPLDQRVRGPGTRPRSGGA